jgi:hypothetical protein
MFIFVNSPHDNPPLPEVGCQNAMIMQAEWDALSVTETIGYGCKTTTIAIPEAKSSEEVSHTLGA